MSFVFSEHEPRKLIYGTGLREDLKLIEVTEDLLKELQENRCIASHASLSKENKSGYYPPIKLCVCFDRISVICKPTLMLPHFLFLSGMSCSLSFKGSPHEEAVLCSSDRTFAVKNVETSNLVLLIEPPQDEGGAGCVKDAKPTLDGPFENGEGQETHELGPRDGREERNGVMTKERGVTITSTAAPVSVTASEESMSAVVVSATAPSHLEIRQIRPKLETLESLLKRNPFGGEGERDEEHRSTDRRLGCTWQELTESVQSSDAELKSALQASGAMCVEGRWRMVDHGYMATLLELVLLTVVEKGWSLEAIPYPDVGRALEEHDYPLFVVLHCLKHFGCQQSPKIENGVLADADGAIATESAMEWEPQCSISLDPNIVSSDVTDTSSKMQHDDGGAAARAVYSLREDLVCRHFGMKLLLETPVWNDLDDFMSRWQASVPEGMTPSLEMLSGEAIADSTSEGRGIRRLTASSLPQEPQERFEVLFKQRKHWELPALKPYIEGLAGPGESIETLLLKYARANQQKPTDPVTYSAR